MIDLTNLPDHPLLEQLAHDTCPVGEDFNMSFYRVMVSYFFSKMASCMGAKIDAPGIGVVPVNCFAFALAPSGFGKNTVVGAIERGTMSGFKKRYQTETFPSMAEQSLYNMACDKALISGKSEEEELERMRKIFNAAGPYPFTAKKATASAIEQLRHKLLMAGSGAINLQVDEIGMNITDKFVMEGLTLFLELYDMGHTDAAVTKNTSENMRVDDIDGSTPANFLGFGTASKLFDGSHAEQAFMQLLDTGYARRCLFAWGERRELDAIGDIEDAYDAMIQRKTNSSVSNLVSHFTDLADQFKQDWMMEVPRETGIIHMAYKLMCGQRKKEIPIHEDIRRTEMEHRHWKALKLAGALAFVDESLEITEDHFLAAVKVVEGSGDALEKVLKPEKPHVKLAKYIADADEPVTHADLYEALPFYTTGQSARNEMMALAIQWGYKNNVIIKKHFEDGIDFFDGESLIETNIDDMIFSYSDHAAFHYTGEEDPVSFQDLEKLVSAEDLHWCNHRFDDGHRCNEKTVPGFNMLVVDVDGECTLDFIHEALADYTFMTATTKRHTPDAHRFRLIFPMSHILKMNQDDYREFMENFFLWLPFKVVDTASNQRSKKWLTNPDALVHLNEGQMLSPHPFIPKTSRNAEYRDQMKELGSLDNLERWFAQRIHTGDRNNQMIKYALALVDSGMELMEVQKRVFTFNNSLSNGLDQDEIETTVMRTVARRFTEAA